jgi:hypothetical protein
MATPTKEPRSYEWNNEFHVQFRLAGRAFHALSEEALSLGTSTNIAAKLLLTQRLDKPTYEAQLKMLRDPHTYRLDDPHGTG